MVKHILLLVTACLLVPTAASAFTLDATTSTDPINGTYEISIQAGSNGTNATLNASLGTGNNAPGETTIDAAWNATVSGAVNETASGSANATIATGPNATFARWIVRFDEMPADLRVGDRYASGRVVLVDDTLQIAAVVAQATTGAQGNLSQMPGVESLETDPRVHAVELTPNDPLFVDQYGPQQVRAPDAWETTLGTDAVTLCVIDSGLRSTHEEITGDRYLGGTDLENGDADPSDDYGHGTHVTVIAAGGTGNGLGVAGMSQSGIHAVKVLDDTGTGFSSTVASGVRWCVDNGGPQTVISMSLGATRPSSSLERAVGYAQENGALLVAASGNGGPCTDCVLYPAAYSEVMAVGCTVEGGALCSYSSRGDAVEISAPGSLILSAYHRSDDDYRLLSGTSMSTPHVSGAAALLWSQAPDRTAAEIRELLTDTAVDAGPAGIDPGFGAGRLDVAAAMDEIIDQPPVDLEPVVTESFDDGRADGFDRTGLWTVTDACNTAASPDIHLAYTNAETCTYETSGASSGTATFTVDLTEATRARLDLEHRWDTESYDTGAYDQMWIEASPAGSGSWSPLASWDSRDANQLAWSPLSLDLSSFTGQPVDVRFRFDTVDGISNRHEGWAIDDVQVLADVPTGPTPNQPPTADAGPDQQLADHDGTGSEPVVLDGTGSSDPDGTISAYAWTLDGDTIATGATPPVELPSGTHSITLTVTDDDGANGTDTLTVEVAPNQPPVAEAGPDQGAVDADGTGGEFVTLDGTASIDPDGTIVRYAWGLDGELASTGPTPTVLVPVGAHTVTLTVTDDGGATTSDTLTVTVDPNTPPTAAFDATTTGLTVATDASDASDPDGPLTSYTWTWGDGGTASGGPLAEHTYAEAGTYTVELTVRDAAGATDTVQRTVTVSAPSQPETIYATDMEDGLPDWTFQDASENLWRLGGGCLGAASGSRSLQFNQFSGCDYRIIGPAAGWVRSPAIDASGHAQVTLAFSHAWETESWATPYDIMRVEARSAPDQVWTTVASWDSRDANQPTFERVELDVSSLASETLQLRFQFDTVDNIANNHPGWAIDDLEIQAGSP